jgi:hypothetical protein
MGKETQVERAPAAEFDHVILYLNKIKTCYPDEQNKTYKQLLEIDVRIHSYFELKGTRPIFVRPRKRRSPFHRFISRCKRFLKKKTISLANSKTFCRRSQAHLPRVVSSVSAPIHLTVQVDRVQCGLMKLRGCLLVYQKEPRLIRSDKNESS